MVILQAELTQDISLEDGQNYQLYIPYGEIRAFKYTIPARLHEGQSILVRAASMRQLPKDFNLLVQPMDPQYRSEAFQLKGREVWKRGQVVMIMLGDSQGYCAGCEVQVVIESGESAYFQVSAETEEEVLEVHENMIRNDLVFENKTKCFLYFVRSDLTDLMIKIATFQGRVNLLIKKYDFQENEEKDYQENEEKDYQEIEVYDRIDYNLSEFIANISSDSRLYIFNRPMGSYSICVQGLQFVSFSLKVYEIMNNDETVVNTFLQDGFEEEFKLLGQSINYHQYIVPIEGINEKILRFQFNIQPISGGDPEVGILFCKKTIKNKCLLDFDKKLKNTSMDSIQYLNRVYPTGQKFKAEITYEYNDCQLDNQLDDCLYIVIVQNNQLRSISYKIQVNMLFSDFKQMREGQIVADEVDHNKYSYYQFKLADDYNIEAIQIRLDKLHGDAKLIASSMFSWPTLEYSEYKGSIQNSEYEIIELTRENREYYSDQSPRTLQETYSIGVYGDSYATFTLLITLLRKNQQVLGYVKSSIKLLEGVSLHQKIGNADQKINSYFYLDSLFDDILLIDYNNPLNNTITYGKLNEQPKENDYDFVLEHGLNQFNNQDAYKVLKANAIYYLMTKANPQRKILNQEQKDDLQFSLVWRRNSWRQHINSNQQLDIYQNTKSTQLLGFIHYLMENKYDIKIAIKSSQIQDLQILITFQTKPAQSNHDFQSKDIDWIGNYGIITISRTQISQATPECSDFNYISSKVCTLYINIYCLNPLGCISNLELSYRSPKNQQLKEGQIRYSSIKQNEFQTYHYVKEYNRTEQWIVQLQNLQGHCFIIAIFILVNSNNLLPDEQQIQSFLLKNANYQSVSQLGNEIMSFSGGYYDQCSTSNKINENDTNYCYIFFGVFPKEYTDSKSRDKNEVNIFSIIIQFGLLELDLITRTHFVNLQSGQFTYLVYLDQMQTSKIRLNVESYNSSLIEIYANKGLLQPSRTDFDFRKEFDQQNFLEISISSPYFQEKNLTQMSDYYVFGLFSTNNQTVQVSLDTQISKFQQLIPPGSYELYLEQFDTAIYKCFMWQKLGRMIDLKVITGKLSFFIFQANTEDLPQLQEQYIDENYIKSKHTWQRQNITSLSSEEESQIVILKQDRNYCINCIIFLLVCTYEQKTQFQIKISNLENAQKQLYFLSIGEIRRIELQGKETKKINVFIIENIDPISITTTILSGSINLYISLTPDINNANYVYSNPNIVKFNQSQFITGKLYYLIVQSNSEYSQLTIQMTQNITITSLQQNLPQVVNFSSFNDNKKLFTYKLPSGNAQIQINIKTRAKGFYPTIYYSIVNQSITQKGIFPPDEQLDNSKLTIRDWDKNIYQLDISFELENSLPNQILAMSVIYYNENLTYPDEKTDLKLIENLRSDAQIIITISDSSIHKILPSTEYSFAFKDLKPLIFKVSFSTNSTLIIKLSDCKGQSQFSLIKNLQDLNTKRINLTITEEYGYKVAVISNLTREYFIVVEPFQVLDRSQKLETEFMIFYEVTESQQKMKEIQSNYIAENFGQIQYEQQKDSQGSIKLSWGDLYTKQVGQDSQRINGVKYKLIKTNDLSVQLGHICAVKHLKEFKILIDESEGVNTFIDEELSDETVQYNVFAMLDEQSISFPYKPILVKKQDFAIQDQSQFLVLAICIVLLLLVTAIAIAIYFYFITKILKNRLSSKYETKQLPQQTEITNPNNNTQLGEISSDVIFPDVANLNLNFDQQPGEIKAFRKIKEDENIEFE
ncbi:UNKNOWN [Stylonychia lemnae]|uniref:Transmembrane protein n=1 Tax=Stylonychia lemnae TaxID=5949 RepID=A0A078A7S9_STYLE|nr:UNKNOWN [Stylonychia lemnae]|eukprot:CDW78315.1 UNKNOWN [Stylonychia lemnae]